MLDTLPDIYINSSKHSPIPPMGISNIYATNDCYVQNKNVKNANIHYVNVDFSFCFVVLRS